MTAHPSQAGLRAAVHSDLDILVIGDCASARRSSHGVKSSGLTSRNDGSVGPDGANDPQHFTYVHALVNDWRAGTGGTLIAIDGSFERGDGCWSALCDVKRAAAEFEDPDSLALRHPHDAADLSQFQPDGLGDVAFGPDPQGVDDELEEEQDLQTAFNAFAQQCLADLRNVV